MRPNERITHTWPFRLFQNAVRVMLVVLLILAILGVSHYDVIAQEDNQLFTFDISIVRSNCQISVWLEDTAGNTIKTICVATKTAKQGLGTYRPHVLPVWAYRHGETYGEGSVYPTVDDPLPDAVTTASPPTGQLEKSWEPDEPVASGEYNFYVEINRSTDPNEFFPNGEPSVIWRGSVTVGNEDDLGTAAIIGHGDENGDNGTVYPDMTTITLSDDYMTGATLVYTAGSQTNSPPQITTVSLPDATEDMPYSHQVEATDPDSGDTVSFSLLNGPIWLDLSSEGLLSGTPLESDVGENIPVTIRARDTGGLADTLATTLTVHGINHPPEITTVSLTDAIVGQSYSLTVIATDSDDDDMVSFSLLTGPDWLDLSSEGLLSGTPSESDTGVDIPVIVRARDTGGLADTLATTITVHGINHPPEITTVLLPDAIVGQEYSFIVSATDPDDGDTVSFSLLTGPDWLELSLEGELVGTPMEDDVGENIMVAIRVNDETGLADTLSTTMHVISETGIESANDIDSFVLHPPYPNPCNAGTMIRFDLPAEGMVYLAICDILGRTVTVLMSERVAAGRHEVWWNGTNVNDEPVGTGSYFYMFRSGSYSSGGKITVLK